MVGEGKGRESLGVALASGGNVSINGGKECEDRSELAGIVE